MKITIIVAPHFDDPELMAGSLLMSYEGTIFVVYVTEGDFLDEQSYKLGLQELHLAKEKISKYRAKKGLGQYEIHHIPEFGDMNRLVINPKAHKEIIDKLEKLLNENECEYYIYPSKSINPSHTITRQIAEGIMRSPYLFKIRRVLMGISEQEKLFSIEENALRDCVYKEISNEDMEFFKKELFPCYANKLKNFPVEKLENYYRFTGDKIGVGGKDGQKYAQSFIPMHITLD